MKDPNIRDSLVLLMSDLSEIISNAKLDRSLALAKLYGSLAWQNPIYIYEARAIEDIVFSKLNQYIPSQLTDSQQYKNKKFLHVLSEGYESGGHTRVVERLVSHSAVDQCQDVLFAGICPKSVLLTISSYGSTTHTINPCGLRSILEIASAMKKYSYVLLHINPDDIQTALAARIAALTGTRVGLYNHADHCFGFGFTAADIVFEVSTYGRAISKNYRSEYNWSYVGIPLETSSSLLVQNSGDFFLSSGPAYKYDFRPCGDFSRILESLIPATNKSVVVIGPGHLPKYASKKLKDFAAAKRLIVMPPVNHPTYLTYLSGCFAYLDSAPITGGSAFPEAALLGKPCLGLTNPLMGYSPIDLCRSPTVSDLIDRALDPNILSKRTHFSLLEEAHSIDFVWNRIRASFVDSSHFDMPLELSKWAIDTDLMPKQWAQSNSLILCGPGFDFLSLNDRILFFALLCKHHLISHLLSHLGIVNFLSLFIVSSHQYRRFRSISLRGLFFYILRFRI